MSEVLILMSDNRNVEIDLKKCEYNTLSTIINYEYSCKHKYHFRYFKPSMGGKAESANCLSPTKKPRYAAWSKIPSCIKVIEEGYKYDFVVYLDSDCIFNHHETSLISYLDQSKNISNEHLNMNLDIFFMNNQPWHRFLPCSGFFVFRPTHNALGFFKTWYQQNQEDKYDLNHPWEQYCLQNYLTKNYEFEIIDDWMFENKKQNQYLKHISRGNPLRKTFFNQIINTYNQEKIESSLEALKELVVAYDTTTIKYD